MLVALDTVSNIVAAGVASADGRSPSVRALPADFDHGPVVLATLDDMLGGDRSLITGVVVSRGPGRYAGLRVGIALGQGLALSLGVPIVTATTFAAAAHASGLATVVAIHPAGRGEWGIQPFRDGAPTAEPAIVAPDALPPGPYAGEGAGDLGGHEVGAAERCLALLQMAPALLAAEGAQPGIEPLYLREPMITLPRRSTLSRAAQQP